MGNEDLELQFCRRDLQTTGDLRNYITATVNSVRQDIRHQVWDEFSYSLDAICAAGGGTLNIYTLPCMYNQM